jgi:hypothetical protein
MLGIEIKVKGDDVYRLSEELRNQLKAEIRHAVYSSSIVRRIMQARRYQTVQFWGSQEDRAQKGIV